MSICPNADGYSVFLDGEIPAEYNKIYQQHLNDCMSCKKTYTQMSELQNILHEDAKGIQLSDAKLKKSYDRLQNLLAFQENTRSTKNNSFVQSLKQVLPAIAAALIIGIFIPVKFKQSENDGFVPTLHAINPTARLMTTKGIIADTRLSTALQDPSARDANPKLDLQSNMLTVVDVLRPSTLNESNYLQIKIYDKTDSFSKSYSGLYQTSYISEGRFQP